MNWLVAVVALVAVQRVVEVRYAERNTRQLLANGAVETAPEQHVYFIALHTAWLAAILFTSRSIAPNWTLIAVFGILQAGRIWVIATLGPLWTTRIISPPNVAPVRRGPYRFMRHPNYAIVAAEIAVLPLAFGNVAVALVFSVLNAALLTWRIRAENQALRLREECGARS